jgi:hypothetical protein
MELDSENLSWPRSGGSLYPSLTRIGILTFRLCRLWRRGCMQTARLFAPLETAMTLAPISLWFRIFVLWRGCWLLLAWISVGFWFHGLWGIDLWKGVSVCCREGLGAEVSYSFVLVLKRELSDSTSSVTVLAWCQDNLTHFHYIYRCNEVDSSCYSSHDGEKERYNCECWKYYRFGTWTMGWCVFSIQSCSSCIEWLTKVCELKYLFLYQHFGTYIL